SPWSSLGQWEFFLVFIPRAKPPISIRFRPYVTSSTSSETAHTDQSVYAGDCLGHHLRGATSLDGLAVLETPVEHYQENSQNLRQKKSQLYMVYWLTAARWPIGITAEFILSSA